MKRTLKDRRMSFASASAAREFASRLARWTGRSCRPEPDGQLFEQQSSAERQSSQYGAGRIREAEGGALGGRNKAVAPRRRRETCEHRRDHLPAI